MKANIDRKVSRRKRLQKISDSVELLEGIILILQPQLDSAASNKAFSSLYYLNRLAKRADMQADILDK